VATVRPGNRRLPCSGTFGSSANARRLATFLRVGVAGCSLPAAAAGAADQLSGDFGGLVGKAGQHAGVGVCGEHDARMPEHGLHDLQIIRRRRFRIRFRLMTYTRNGCVGIMVLWSYNSSL
jgi:hypothetical protein